MSEIKRFVAFAVLLALVSFVIALPAIYLLLESQ